MHIGAVAGVQADAQAAAHMQLVGADDEGLAQRVEQLLGDRDRGGAPVQRGQADDKLVAALARRGVAGAQAAAQPRRGGLEDLVTGLVAERVVDVLEMVEVEEHHRHLHAAALRLRDAVAKHQPVRQPGEHVVLRQVADALLVVLAFGDVGGDAADCEQLAVGALERKAQREVGVLAVGLRRVDLELAEANACPCTRVDATEHIVDPLADHVDTAGEGLAIAPVHQQEAPLQVAHEDDRRRVVDDRLQQPAVVLVGDEQSLALGVGAGAPLQLPRELAAHVVEGAGHLVELVAAPRTFALEPQRLAPEPLQAQVAGVGGHALEVARDPAVDDVEDEQGHQQGLGRLGHEDDAGAFEQPGVDAVEPDGDLQRAHARAAGFGLVQFVDAGDVAPARNGAGGIAFADAGTGKAAMVRA
ncbi:MAG TPA: hypothetical protein VGJ65_23245 [Albitalea sp.]